MEHVHIFDTTLRDGEQSPGFSMNREEKLQLAHQLEQLGVDVIEAGFPIASPGDLEGVRAVATEIRGCRVAALARARREDVDAALRAIEPAAKPRLHIFLASSDLHLKHKLRISRKVALEQIHSMVRYGTKHCEEVEFSAEDASRTDLDFLLEVIESGRSCRRVDYQSAGHCRLHHAGGIRRHVPISSQASRCLSQDCSQCTLPQRPGPCGGEFARGHRRGSAPGGMHY